MPNAVTCAPETARGDRVVHNENKRLAERLNVILESTTDAVGFIDRDWRITYVNGRAEHELPGIRTMIGHRIWDAFPDAAVGDFFELCSSAMHHNEGGAVEEYYARFKKWYELHVRPSSDGIAIFFRDITRQKRASDALSRSEALLKDALNAGRIVAWEWDLATGTVVRSDNAEEVLGFGSGKAAEFVERVHPDDRARLEANWQEARATGAFSVELRFQRPDGKWIWVEERARFEFKADGTPKRLVGLLSDISARKQAEIEAQEKARLLETTLEHMHQGLMVIGPDRRIPLCNRRTAELLGISPAMIVPGASFDELLAFQTASGEFANADAATQAMVTSGGLLQGHHAYERERPNGTVLEIRTVPLAGGGAVRTFTDVTARRKAERRIKESEARYRLLADHATDMIVRTGAGGVDLYVSPACRDLIGYEQHEIAGMSFRDHLHPEDTEAVLAGLGRLFAGTQDHETSTYRVRHKSGHWVWVEAHRRLVRDAGGNPQEVVSVVRDVSARRGLEEQLRQAQKMEAVGQLTGGIAHDFNNLLTVVIGNAEVLAEELQEPESRGLAALILEAAEKGAGLTQQLLAFGRRQTLRAEALDVPAVVQGMLPLLRRTLGETVILKTEFPSPPPTALADRSLLESAILNLAINARDAMPAGGLLEIVVDEVFVDAGARVDGPVPGHYASVVVSDTGSGMSPEVLQHAFEPFFTTKGIGKGSGLGLSMVYGFAQQSGGHVSIRSKPAGGTSVTILLPLALASSAEPKPSEPSRMSRTRGSRVLVVEDELEVRRFMTSLLLTLGYEVVEAGTGSTGLKMIRSDPTLDLLLTDVVLPGGVSGLELAREAQRIRPNLKVLLTSGYPEPVSKDDGAMPGMEVLQKPYRRRDLAEAVRRVLDARPLTRRAGV